MYEGKAVYGEGLCARSEEILQRVLLIAGISPRYQDQDVDMIVSAVRKATKAIL